MRPLQGSRRPARGVGCGHSMRDRPLGDGVAMKTERASNLGDGQALAIPAVADPGEPLVVDHDCLGGQSGGVGGPCAGYGTSIIRELIPFELGVAVELSIVPEGTRCRLEIPGEWTSKDGWKADGDRVSD
jgi:hypothetical protein